MSLLFFNSYNFKKASPLSKLLFTYGFNSTSNEQVFNLKCDNSNNLYAMFYYNVDFNVRNLDGTSTGRTYVSVAGSTGVALVKYNSSGTVVWSVRILTQNNAVTGLLVDNSGNVYGFGQRGANMFRLYNANDVLTGVTVGYTGGGDSVIFKYDSNGNPLWAARIANTFGETMTGAFVDSSGNVYVSSTNLTNAKSVFNSDGTVFKTLLYVGGNDTCLVKYNSSGFAQWAATIGGSSNEDGGRVFVDSSGNVCIVGVSISNPLSIYNANDTLFGTISTTTNDVFFIRYNATTGNALSGIFLLSGTGDDGLTDTFIDNSGNVYLTGTYSSNPLNINNFNGTSSGTTLTNSGNYDAYLLKYNSSGTLLWATRCGGTAYDESRSISIGSDGSVYLVGNYQSNPITIYNSNGSVFATYNLVVANDMFIVKYNSNGIGQWSTNLTGSGNDQFVSVAVDSNDNVYCGGLFSSTPLTINNINGTVYTTTNTTGSNDIILLRNIYL